MRHHFKPYPKRLSHRRGNAPLNAQAAKSAVRPLDFYRRELPGMPTPRRDTGWVDGGLCPFHDDRHSGNFRVNLTTGAFTCFACDTKGPDILAFTQKRDGLSFPDALRSVADQWRVRV